MATERIKNSDISEKDPFGDLRSSAEKALVPLNSIKKEIEEIAKDLKKDLSTTGVRVTFDQFEEGRKKVQEANKVLNAYEEVQKKIARAEKLRDQSLSSNAKTLTEVRVETQQQNKILRDNARLNSTLTTAYQKQSIRLNQLRAEYKGLVFEQKGSTTEARNLKREIDRLDSSLKKVDRSVGQGGRSVGLYSKALNGLGKIAGGLGLAIAFDSIVDTGRELVRLSQEVRGVEFAFRGLGKEGSDAFLRVRNSTRGLLSDLDIKRSLVEFDNFNISLEETDTLFEFLSVRAAQTGKSVDKLRDSLVEGLSKESKLRIDNLGISTADLNSELEKTPDFVEAVANIARREIAEAGDILDDVASSQERWNAFIENTRTSLARGIAPIVASVTNRLLDFAGASNRVSDSLIKQRSELNILVKSITGANVTEESRLRLISELNDKYPEFLDNLDAETVSNEDLAERLRIVNAELLRKIDLQIKLEEQQENISRLTELRRQELELIKTITNLEERGGRARGAGRANAIRLLRENRAEQEGLLKSINELEESTSDYQKELENTNRSTRKRTSSTKEQSKEERELTGLIEKQREILKNLNDERERSGAETEILGLSKEIEIAEKELERLLNLGKQKDEIKEEIEEDNVINLVEIPDGPTQTFEDFFQDRIQRFKELNQAISDIAEEFADRRIESINREISAVEQRQKSLQELAARGQKDAQDSIALEQKRAAELELERQRQERKKRLQALGTSAVETYLSKVEQGDENALPNTFRDISLLTSFVRALPAFQEGTEYATFDPKSMIDIGTTRDNFVARHEKGERIIPRDMNKNIDMSNKDLTSLAMRYQNGTLFDTAKAFNMTNTLDTSRLESEIKSVREELKLLPHRMPEVKFYYDSIREAFVKETSKRNNTEIRVSKKGGIWG